MGKLNFNKIDCKRAKMKDELDDGSSRKPNPNKSKRAHNSEMGNSNFHNVEFKSNNGNGNSVYGNQYPPNQRNFYPTGYNKRGGMRRGKGGPYQPFPNMAKPYQSPGMYPSRPPYGNSPYYGPQQFRGNHAHPRTPGNYPARNQNFRYLNGNYGPPNNGIPQHGFQNNYHNMNQVPYSQHHM